MFSKKQTCSFIDYRRFKHTWKFQCKLIHIFVPKTGESLKQNLSTSLMSNSHGIINVNYSETSGDEMLFRTLEYWVIKPEIIKLNAQHNQILLLIMNKTQYITVKYHTFNPLWRLSFMSISIFLQFFDDNDVLSSL